MIRIKLAGIMDRRSIGQRQLARVTGIRPATIHRLYHGTIDFINVDHMDLICEALDCDINDILEYTPNAQRRTGENIKRSFD